MTESRMTLDAFAALIDADLPMCGLLGIRPLEIGAGTALLELPWRPDLVRPGGTMAGPALMTLADVALYGAVLGAIGPVPLAVTTDMTTHFLRKPAETAIIARARVLKAGKRLAICDAELFSKGREAEGAVAHVVGTYSVPPA